MAALFGDEVMPHLEFIRYGGRVTASGLPLVRYTDAARLGEIIAGHKRVDADQLRFRASADPSGLLNPGKMRSYRPVA